MNISKMKTGLNRAGARLSEDSLVRVDYQTLLLGVVLLLAFLVAVALQLNGSSLPRWNRVVPQAGQEKDGLLLGQSRAIRSDEWLTITPWIMSQGQLGFPLRNGNVGAHSDPLLQSLPVEHFSTLARPQNWGYFLLDIGHGFSFYWNFKVFALFGSFFLLLMLLTRSRFWLSLAGSAWLFLSSFIQWWFSTTLPEMLAAFFLAFVALCYLLLSHRRWVRLTAWLVLVVSTLDFILFFYPAYQVPLVYLFVFLLAGFLVSGGRYREIGGRLGERALLLGAAAVVILAALFFFYRDAHDTIVAITSTAYPGDRISTGGGFGVMRLFGGLTGYPRADENSFPAMWVNASEASNFILLFPVVVLAALYNAARRIKNSPLVALLSLYVVLICVWILVPFPSLLARLTLMSYVPSTRALLAAGIGSIILTMVFLAETGRRRLGTVFPVLVAIVVFLTLLVYAAVLRRDVNGFFQLRYLILMVAGVTVAAWLLLRGRALLFSLLIIAAVLPNLFVNPLSRGLGPIVDKDAFKAAVAANDAAPGARWLAYGDNTLAQFLKAGGLNVADGVSYTPDLDFFRALDPQGKNEEVYNRYANIAFLEPKPGRAGTGGNVDASGDGPAAGNAGARFTLLQPDAFTVEINPCDPELGRLGITNFAFAYQPNEKKLSCLSPLAAFPESHVWLYQRLAPLSSR